MTTAALILAAGASTRLGTPKQLLRLDGEMLLDRTIRLTRQIGCTPIVVVLGANAETIRAACDLSSTIVIVNPGWPEGMASSIRHGLIAVPSTAELLLILTCDQPALTPDHLRNLIAATSTQATATAYAETNGVPACFPRSTFAALGQLTGDTGARHILHRVPAIAFSLAALDIDSPEDLRRAKILLYP